MLSTAVQVRVQIKEKYTPLAAFHREQFSEKKIQDRHHKNADIEVSLKYTDTYIYTGISEYLFGVENMVRYIYKKLKRGAAPGCDGVSSEHLKFVINTIGTSIIAYCYYTTLPYHILLSVARYAGIY